MHTDGTFVVFSAEDCSHLSRVLNEYTTYNSFPSDETVALKEVGSQAWELSFLYEMAKDWPDLPPEFLREVLTDEVLEGQPKTELGTQNLVLENANPRMERIIKALQWGAGNLISGGIAIQNRVGPALNSSFETGPVSRTLGSTNDRLAARIADGLIEAGQKAGEWVTQLANY